MAKILGYSDGEIARLYLLPTSLVVVACLLISLPVESRVMEWLFYTIMLESISGWIPLYAEPSLYVKMLAIGLVSYAAVAMLELRRIRRVPMDEALKIVEWGGTPYETVWMDQTGRSAGLRGGAGPGDEHPRLGPEK